MRKCPRCSGWLNKHQNTRCPECLLDLTKLPSKPSQEEDAVQDNRQPGAVLNEALRTVEDMYQKWHKQQVAEQYIRDTGIRTSPPPSVVRASIGLPEPEEEPYEDDECK